MSGLRVLALLVSIIALVVGVVMLSSQSNDEVKSAPVSKEPEKQLATKQDYIGSWEGVLKVNPTISLVVVFHIAEKNGQVVMTMDSPEQNAFGLAMDSAQVKEGG